MKALKELYIKLTYLFYQDSASLISSVVWICVETNINWIICYDVESQQAYYKEYLHNLVTDEDIGHWLLAWREDRLIRKRCQVKYFGEPLKNLLACTGYINNGSSHNWQLKYFSGSFRTLGKTCRTWPSEKLTNFAKNFPRGTMIFKLDEGNE